MRAVAVFWTYVYSCVYLSPVDTCMFTATPTLQYIHTIYTLVLHTYMHAIHPHLRYNTYLHYSTYIRYIHWYYIHSWMVYIHTYVTIHTCKRKNTNVCLIHPHLHGNTYIRMHTSQACCRCIIHMHIVIYIKVSKCVYTYTLHAYIICTYIRVFSSTGYNTAAAAVSYTCVI